MRGKFLSLFLSHYFTICTFIHPLFLFSFSFPRWFLLSHSNVIFIQHNNNPFLFYLRGYSTFFYIGNFSLLLTVRNITYDVSLLFLCFKFTTKHFFSIRFDATFHAIDFPLFFVFPTFIAYAIFLHLICLPLLHVVDVSSSLFFLFSFFFSIILYLKLYYHL